MSEPVTVVPGPFERTIRKPATAEGHGIHTGAGCRVTLFPAEASYGRRFVRNGAEIEAVAENVSDTRRCTVLGRDRARVSTVEHLLSALNGLGIDSVRIHVDGEELPILDGSALPWVRIIRGAGLARLALRSKRLRLGSAVRAALGGSVVEGSPSRSFSLTSVTVFDHPMLGTEILRSPTRPSDFENRIALARTFGLEEEVAALRAAGLARGGSLENALVVRRDGFASAERIPGECHAHKLLDLWGDLALAGHRLVGDIVAIRPGHAVNVAFALAVRKAAGLYG